MIQLRIAPYSLRELKEIRARFRKMSHELTCECQHTSWECDTCPMKHLCTDLDSTLAWLSKEIIKRTGGSENED